MNEQDQPGAAQTIVGLFDDDIAAEHVLAELRKSNRPAATVSVLARDRRAVDKSTALPIDVTTAVMDTALSAVSNWLLGLAALMVPRQGSYLAAGPLGVLLVDTDDETERAGRDSAPEGSRSEPIGSVGHAFERFGFRPEEAHYLEQRLAAGSVILAVTSHEHDQIESTLDAFGENEAVFIGQAITPNDVVERVIDILAHPLSAGTTEVVVTDSVLPLERASALEPEHCPWLSRVGNPIVDVEGEHFADIDDLLVDLADTTVVRYVIAGRGGLLGIGRKRFAIPIEVIDLDVKPARARLPKHRFADLPEFEEDVPFSRKDELAAHQATGTRPVWQP